MLVATLGGCGNNHPQLSSLRADVNDMIRLIEQGQIRSLIVDYDAIHYVGAPDPTVVNEVLLERFRERIAPALLVELKLTQKNSPAEIGELEDGTWVAIFFSNRSKDWGIQFEKYPGESKWRFSYAGI